MRRTAARAINGSLLHRWPLPQPDHDRDKEERGDVLIIGGSAETPGAVALAATAALRAGAGRLSIATDPRVAPVLAVHLPEGRVIALPPAKAGQRAGHGWPRLVESLRRCALVLAGPGWLDEPFALATTRHLLVKADEKTAVVLDGLAMGAATSGAKPSGPIVLTPHAGEMAHLCGITKAEVLKHAQAIAEDAARHWRCVVVLKGATTFVATPEGALWRHEKANAGLATSGSGDVLAGLIAGLGARGAALEQAAVWGVAVHARAGDSLAKRVGPLGFLARELPGEIPRLMRTMA